MTSVPPPGTAISALLSGVSPVSTGGIAAWLVSAAFLCLLFTAVWLVWHRSRGARSEPGAKALAIFGGLVLLVAYASVLATVPGIRWNTPRVVLSVAFDRGFSLYYPPEYGPVLSLIAGPVGPLAFLPAALGRTPVSCLLLGGAVNLLLALCPLVCFLFARPPEGGGRLAGRWFGLLFGASALVLVNDTFNTLWTIHTDVPAFGLGLLSSAALSFALANGDGRRRGVALSAAAALAVLSVWAKQVAVPLLPAQLLYLGLALGWRVAVGYGLRLAAVGLSVTAVFTASFGFRAMWINMFVVPSAQPWTGDWTVMVARLAWANLAIAPLWAVGAFAALAVRLADSRRGATWPCTLRRHGWLMLFLVALALEPTGAMAMMKYGGGGNSFHTCYFAVAGAASAVAWAYGGFDWGRFGTLARRVCATLAIVAVLAAGVRVWVGSRMRPWLWTGVKEQGAYEMIRNQPGVFYFPWNPLAHLLAEGRLYHHDYAVIDRTLGGFPLDRARVRAEMPQGLRAVVYPNNSYTYFMLTLLPEFSRHVKKPGWDFWIRPSQ